MDLEERHGVRGADKPGSHGKRFQKRVQRGNVWVRAKEERLGPSDERSSDEETGHSKT